MVAHTRRSRLAVLAAGLGRRRSTADPSGGAAPTIEVPDGGAARGAMAGRAPVRLRTVLLIVLPIALIVQFVVLDRVSVQLAEHEMATQIRSGAVADMPCGTTPPTVRDVSIGGFPFLTQVLTGRFSDLGLTMTGMPTPGPRIEAINVHLKGVHVPIVKLATGGEGDITVDRMRAAVRITYADLNAYLAGQPGKIRINPVDGGRRLEISASADVPLLGAQQLAGIVTFAVHNNLVTLIPSQISLSGLVNITIPLGFLSGVLTSLPIPLGDLPYHLNVTSAETDATGLSLAATASDITVPPMDETPQCRQAGADVSAGRG
ncbi:DUF2993 domain-containing protein [Frankia sp. AiPa1]|uniref:LmeA family phospholipid-binding protein n=1 Tax=Frankia sp. AiPa1 TaxID=573492 RepID=UPI00202AE042|nr:DUF2993 domain-containing protein [Frankia sp. AiPa1]MCL9758179.1 DUF2993 domain-containing protein [Frankia sp. AiPa1]